MRPKPDKRQTAQIATAAPPPPRPEVASLLCLRGICSVCGFVFTTHLQVEPSTDNPWRIEAAGRFGAIAGVNEMAKYYMQTEDGRVIQTAHPEYWKEAKRLPAKEGFAAYAEQCRAELLRTIQPKTTVYVLMRHVSSSGMSRRMSLFVIGSGHDGKPELHRIDHLAAVVAGFREGKETGVIMSGCGMDMGFAAVYELGARLWPNGTPEPHSTRNGEPDNSGGYALKHQWL